jgi:hypothetical protein
MVESLSGKKVAGLGAPDSALSARDEPTLRKGRDIV